MDPKQIISGKNVLIVDDEQDVLDSLTELLDMCQVDSASSYGQAKDLLEGKPYDIVVLDIMGVNGFELLALAKQKKIPALMLTAHALTEESLKRSAEDGASYYAPKDEISNIALFIADVLEAKEKNKNPWVTWFERLGGFFDRVFGSKSWRERDRDFWAEYFIDD